MAIVVEFAVESAVFIVVGLCSIAAYVIGIKREQEARYRNWQQRVTYGVDAPPASPLNHPPQQQQQQQQQLQPQPSGNGSPPLSPQHERYAIELARQQTALLTRPLQLQPQPPPPPNHPAAAAIPAATAGGDGTGGTPVGATPIDTRTRPAFVPAGTTNASSPLTQQPRAIPNAGTSGGVTPVRAFAFPIAVTPAAGTAPQPDRKSAEALAATTAAVAAVPVPPQAAAAPGDSPKAAPSPPSPQHEANDANDPLSMNETGAPPIAKPPPSLVYDPNFNPVSQFAPTRGTAAPASVVPPFPTAIRHASELSPVIAHSELRPPIATAALATHHPTHAVMGPGTVAAAMTTAPRVVTAHTSQVGVTSAGGGEGRSPVAAVTTAAGGGGTLKRQVTRAGSALLIQVRPAPQQPASGAVTPAPMAAAAAAVTVPLPPTPRDFQFYCRRLGLCSSIIALVWSIDLHGGQRLIHGMISQIMSVTCEAICFEIMSIWISFHSGVIYRQLKTEIPEHLRSALLGLPVVFWVLSCAMLLTGLAIDRNWVYGPFAFFLAATLIMYLLLAFIVYRSLTGQLRAFIEATQRSTLAKGLVVDTAHIRSALRRLLVFMCVLAPFGTGFALLVSAITPLFGSRVLISLISFVSQMLAIGVLAVIEPRVSWPLQPPPDELSTVWYAVVLDAFGWLIMAGLAWYSMPLSARAHRTGRGTNSGGVVPQQIAPPQRVPTAANAPTGSEVVPLTLSPQNRRAALQQPLQQQQPLQRTQVVVSPLAGGRAVPRAHALSGGATDSSALTAPNAAYIIPSNQTVGLMSPNTGSLLGGSPLPTDSVILPIGGAGSGAGPLMLNNMTSLIGRNANTSGVGIELFSQELGETTGAAAGGAVGTAAGVGGAATSGRGDGSKGSQTANDSGTGTGTGSNTKPPLPAAPLPLTPTDAVSATAAVAAAATATATVTATVTVHALTPAPAPSTGS